MVMLEDEEEEVKFCNWWVKAYIDAYQVFLIPKYPCFLAIEANIMYILFLPLEQYSRVSVRNKTQ